MERLRGERDRESERGREERRRKWIKRERAKGTKKACGQNGWVTSERSWEKESEDPDWRGLRQGEGEVRELRGATDTDWA